MKEIYVFFYPLFASNFCRLIISHGNWIDRKTANTWLNVEEKHGYTPSLFSHASHRNVTKITQSIMGNRIRASSGGKWSRTTITKKISYSNGVVYATTTLAPELLQIQVFSTPKRFGKVEQLPNRWPIGFLD